MKGKMKNSKHGKAIDNLYQKLKIEFQKSNIGKGTKGKGVTLVPDIWIEIKGGYIIIEVGAMFAEKLNSYLHHSLVKEIRWYDTNENLVFVWDRSKEPLLGIGNSSDNFIKK